ncbi:MAG: BNR-4 repeat-containing protein [Armatimonadetes bacterium]|nr:BNR-4 repeat-containing protein [Armatimonadota bacterium]
MRLMILTATALLAGAVLGQEASAPPADYVRGDLVQFIANGGWCWYQDERLLVDPAGGRLLIGSVANALGLGGKARDADIDVTGYHLASGARTNVTLRNLPSYGGGDDHNAAAFWIRPDGRYLAVYTGHNEASRRTWYRISERPHDATAWGPEQSFDWGAAQPGTKSNVTYSNLFYLSAEKRLYNIAREDQRSPNIAVSDDFGSTWRYLGKLTVPRTHVAYSDGYFRFADNGVDRIDFIATEHHPRDFNNGIFHGYIQGGRTYNSTGKLLDDRLDDEKAPAPEDFTRVFQPSAEDGVDDATDYHRGWTIDLGYWAPGQPHALFLTRYGTQTWPLGAKRTPQNSGAADHRLFYARCENGVWRSTELCHMGHPLYPAEQDYTGLGALHRDHPNVLYVSTPVDPRDNRPLAHRELFRGETDDAGHTWAWTPITWDSSADNCRPIVPAWDSSHTALLWWRGRYDSQRSYDTAVVGLIDRDDAPGPVSFTPATPANTTLPSGGPVPTTGPSAARGAADGTWHRRLVTAEGPTVFAAGEAGEENVPPLATTVDAPADGVYDVYAYFWSNPAEDWRLAAGLADQPRMVFRRQACQRARADEFDGTVPLTAPTVALYRAFLGRVTAKAGQGVVVHLDDTPDRSPDGRCRTWYAGVGLARSDALVPWRARPADSSLR